MPYVHENILSHTTKTKSCTWIVIIKTNNLGKSVAYMYAGFVQGGGLTMLGLRKLISGGGGGGGGLRHIFFLPSLTFIG